VFQGSIDNPERPQTFVDLAGSPFVRNSAAEAWAAPLSMPSRVAHERLIAEKYGFTRAPMTTSLAVFIPASILKSSVLRVSARLVKLWALLMSF
jgi:hypothetical protein